MVCLGLEPGAAGWKAQTNPLSYSGTPWATFYSNFWSHWYGTMPKTESIR